MRAKRRRCYSAGSHAGRGAQKNARESYADEDAKAGERNH